MMVRPNRIFDTSIMSVLTVPNPNLRSEIWGISPYWPGLKFLMSA